MTTRVTVTASGPCYPARLIVKDNESGKETVNQLIASGYSFETWVGTNVTATVTEEYHAAGYPAPVEAPEKVAA